MAKVHFLIKTQGFLNDMCCEELKWIAVGAKWCILFEDKEKVAVKYSKSYPSLRRTLSFHKFKRIPVYNKYSKSVVYALTGFTPTSTATRRPYTQRLDSTAIELLNDVLLDD